MVQIQKSFSESVYGKLYLVPTPIGNLEDMTFRAVNALTTATLIACEDTRHTKKLLNHFDIHVPQVSFHEHNTKQKIPVLIDCLKKGEDVALVSDAGMPCISDPGQELVEACVGEGIDVVSLPGANAALTALIASGLPAKQFYFYGFPPRKTKEQKELFESFMTKKETMLFYESPFRVKKTLENMAFVFGENRRVVICRELTKKYEEYIRGSLSEIVAVIDDLQIKGEICLVVEGAKIDNQNITSDMIDRSVKEHVDFYMQTENLTQKEAIKKVAKLLQRPKQDIYKEIHGG